MGKWLKQALNIEISEFFFKRTNKHKNQTKFSKLRLSKISHQMIPDLNGTANFLMFKSSTPGLLRIVKDNPRNYLFTNS